MRNFAIHGGFTGLAASTRVRLARNVKGYPYRNLTPGQQNEIAQKVWDAISAAPAVANGLHMTEVRAGSQEAMQLIERHMISPEFAQRGGHLIASDSGDIAIMLGEEDPHLACRSWAPACAPRSACRPQDGWQSSLRTRVPFDYSDKLGYLTACPSNLGTACACRSCCICRF